MGIEETSIVIASGEHDLHYIKMSEYKYFRRDYNLSSYKLEYVSGYFIGDEVKRIEHYDCVYAVAVENVGTRARIYGANLAGLETGNYIVFEETNNSTDSYKDFGANSWFARMLQ